MIATIIVVFVLALIVTGAVYSIVKDKKAGKSSCGCSCGNCPNAKYCHQTK